MKNLKDTYVIIKKYEDQYSFFQDYVSFDKSELDAKCEMLNKELNDSWKKNSILRKTIYTPITVFTVVSLYDAIDMFTDLLNERND